MSKNAKKSDVTIELLPAAESQIGVIKLNSPKTLNSLTLDMVRDIRTALDEWRQDDTVALVILSGEGEKAFCAGGDVQKLYQSAIDTPGGPCEYAETFFFEEYQLNYLIHAYEKPILCFGNGIVMGGGLGLMAGASHRIVGERTRIAMPEITIGLFPDVGGTWFLNRMPYGLGIFFALTGAPINAADAIYCRLADHVVPVESNQTLLDSIQASAWSSLAEENHLQLTELILAHLKAHPGTKPISEVAPIHGVLSDACQQSSLGEIVNDLEALDVESTWFDKALNSLRHGSPLSSLLIYEQLKRYRHVDLRAIFESELILASNIVRFPEFAEGVRALLIDKDNEPKWQFAHFSAVPATRLETFFTPPWPSNPLSEALDLIDGQTKE